MPQALRWFKYRSLDNWRFLVDILVNKRLYAAPFKALNDPMEGRYRYASDEVTKAFRRAISEEKDQLRICSLSRDPRSTLMWSYYAGGHKGVVLGLKIPRPQHRWTRHVKYDEHVRVGPNHLLRPARDVAMEILSQKHQSWTHEQEVRVFSKGPYVPIELKEVRLGLRASTEDEELLTALLAKTNPGISPIRIKLEEMDAPPDSFDLPGGIGP